MFGVYNIKQELPVWVSPGWFDCLVGLNWLIRQTAYVCGDFHGKAVTAWLLSGCLSGSLNWGKVFVLHELSQPVSAGTKWTFGEKNGLTFNQDCFSDFVCSLKFNAKKRTPSVWNGETFQNSVSCFYQTLADNMKYAERFWQISGVFSYADTK